MILFCFPPPPPSKEREKNDINSPRGGAPIARPINRNVLAPLNLITGVVLLYVSLLYLLMGYKSRGKTGRQWATFVNQMMDLEIVFTHGFLFRRALPTVVVSLFLSLLLILYRTELPITQQSLFLLFLLFDFFFVLFPWLLLLLLLFDFAFHSENKRSLTPSLPNKGVESFPISIETYGHKRCAQTSIGPV